MSTKGEKGEAKASKKLKRKETSEDPSPSKKSKKSDLKDAESTELDLEIKRDKNGKLVFSDFPDFKPNLSPEEVMKLGSFGGTYFRPISSGVTKEKYTDAWKEFPEDWFTGLNIKKQVRSTNELLDPRSVVL